MNKVNKKGFAISGIIYAALIFFLAVLFGILMILINRRGLFKNLYDDTVVFLENDYTKYRLIAKADFCGMEGTGHDSVVCGDFDLTYTDYYDKFLVTFDPYDINIINNQGLLKDKYNLDIINGQIKVTRGAAAIVLNESTTIDSTIEIENTDITYKTIYFETILDSCSENFISFGENINISFTGNSTNCSKIELTNDTNTTSSTALDYTIGDLLQLFLIWNEDNLSYDIISNGEKLETTSSETAFELLSIEGFSMASTEAQLFDLRLSSALITEYEAINITTGNYDLNYKLNELNTELIYKFIEYK